MPEKDDKKDTQRVDTQAQANAASGEAAQLAEQFRAILEEVKKQIQSEAAAVINVPSKRALSEAVTEAVAEFSGIRDALRVPELGKPLPEDRIWTLPSINEKAVPDKPQDSSIL